MRLNEIANTSGSHKRRKRIGRGIGSGHGKTAGRGHKGQKSRTGVSVKCFEGGQLPLHRRLPKRGFQGRSKKAKLEYVNLGRIQELIDAGRLSTSIEITNSVLVHVGAVKRPWVKILGEGEIKSVVRVRTSAISKQAQNKIERLGGEVCVSVSSSQFSAMNPGDIPMHLKGAANLDPAGRLELDLSVGRSKSDDLNFDDYVVIFFSDGAELDSNHVRLGDLVKAQNTQSKREQGPYRVVVHGVSKVEEPDVGFHLLYKNRLVQTQRLPLSEKGISKQRDKEGL